MDSAKPFGPLVEVLLGAFERQLKAYLSLSAIAERLVDVRRQELIGSGYPGIVELAELSEIAAELERGRRGALADDQSVKDIREALDGFSATVNALQVTDRCRVEVRAADLLPALDALAAAQRRGTTVRVSFSDGELQFTRAATTVRVSARGSWPLVATVSPALLKELGRRRKALPELVVVEGTHSMLHFSHYSIPCSWTPHPPSPTKAEEH